jgi:hypothetical protein
MRWSAAQRPNLTSACGRWLGHVAGVAWPMLGAGNTLARTSHGTGAVGAGLIIGRAQIAVARALGAVVDLAWDPRRREAGAAGRARVRGRACGIMDQLSVAMALRAVHPHRLSCARDPDVPIPDAADPGLDSGVRRLASALYHRRPCNASWRLQQRHSWVRALRDVDDARWPRQRCRSADVRRATRGENRRLAGRSSRPAPECLAADDAPHASLGTYEVCRQSSCPRGPRHRSTGLRAPASRAQIRRVHVAGRAGSVSVYSSVVSRLPAADRAVTRHSWPATAGRRWPRRLSPRSPIALQSPYRHRRSRVAFALHAALGASAQAAVTTRSHRTFAVAWISPSGSARAWCGSSSRGAEPTRMTDGERTVLERSKPGHRRSRHSG